MPQLAFALTCWVCSSHANRLQRTFGQFPDSAYHERHAMKESDHGVPVHEGIQQKMHGMLDPNVEVPFPLQAFSRLLLAFNVAGSAPARGERLPGAGNHRVGPPLMESVILSESTEQLSETSAGSQTISLGTLRIPKMGMGTLNWPLDKTTDPDSAAALRACIDGGVTFFDTAELYGFGKSEELLKDCVLQSGASVTLATKFAPLPWRQRPEDVVKAARAAAERMGVDAIDLYQIHWPDFIQPLKAFGIERRKDEEYWEGIALAYEQGLIKNVGVSNYGPKMLQRAIEYLGKRGIKIVSNQINYSLLFRKGVTQETVDFCRERGIAVLGYFPLANGLLAGKYSAENMPKGVKRATMKKYVVGGVTDRGIVYPEGGVTPLIEEMRNIANRRGKTIAQVALNWVMCKGVIPIPGCRNAKMAADNCGAMGWSLDDSEVRSLEAAADEVGFQFSNGGFELE